jgi:hypothetical protein
VSALPIHSTIDQLHSAGLKLSLTAESGLRVTPASGITPTLRDLIRNTKTVLVDYLRQPVERVIEAANDAPDPFVEPDGYAGTAWRLAGTGGLSRATLAKFRATSLALDAKQSENNLLLQGAMT